MRNVFIKSLLLIVAILAAVGVVLYFVKTVVEPPMDSKHVEVFNPDMTEYIQLYNPSRSNLKSAEDSLDLALDRIDVFFLNSGEEAVKLNKDKYVQQVVSKFVPVFNEWSIGKFSASVWNSTDHREMQRIIKKLRRLTINDGGKIALSSQQNSKLSNIEYVIADYNAAWSASRNTGFSNGLQNIATANEYKNKPFIRNCSALVNALNDVPRKVMLNHYNYVYVKVRALSNPSSFSNRDVFNSNTSAVYSEIERFRNASYGVDKRDQVNQLLNMFDEYKSYARSYQWDNEFQNKI